MLLHNGTVMEDDAALFGFDDRIRLGDGVFDTMLILLEGHNLILLHIDKHVSRLLNHAKAMKIKHLPKAKELQEQIKDYISASNISEGRYVLNTLITRGSGERGVMPPENAAPSITMRLSPAPTEFAPIHAVISETVRRNEGSPLSRIKSCNYGDNILALLEAREKGANEAILLNNEGHVTCASAGNIFACIGDALVTPPLEDGVLDGVTRQVLMEKFAVRVRSLTAEDLQNAAGIYITNSIRGAAPLQSLNGEALPAPAVMIDKDFNHRD